MPASALPTCPPSTTPALWPVFAPIRPPAYKGRGPRPKRGKTMRPLARTRTGKTIAATPADSTAVWHDGKHRLTAQVWNGLVLPDAKPDAAGFRIIAVCDPRYKEPLLLATTLDVMAWAVWRLYRERWAVEQPPLAAKPPFP